MPDAVPAGDGWRVEELPSSSRVSVLFMVVVAVGVTLLWFATPPLGLWMMGDCFSSTPECDALFASVAIWARMLAVILLANTATGLVAFLAGGRRWAVVPLLLVSGATALVCAATLVLPNGAGTALHPLLPLLLPGSLVLAIGAGWRLRRLRAWRRTR